MDYYNKRCVFHLLTLISAISLSSAAAAKPKAKPINVTAIYAFGDSIFDAGNNNGLPTLCRSDHKPYGVDFPNEVPSGRFTDGMLPVDFLIADLGIKRTLPAYKDASITVEDYPTGVTFASSCSGLDDLTAKEMLVLSMDRQYEYFKKTFETMLEKIGIERTVHAVENALFLISGGTNDMIDNYYPLPIRRLFYSVSDYHYLLLRNLANLIKKLHSKGAKRVAVLGMPPLGCLPISVTSAIKESNGKRRCVAQYNTDARSYNYKLQAVIKRLRMQLPRCNIVYTDIYSPIMQMINTPKKYGLEHVLEGCCGTGALETGQLCGKLLPICSDRSKYLFWDAAHPTQAAYKILTKHFESTVLKKLVS